MAGCGCTSGSGGTFESQTYKFAPGTPYELPSNADGQAGWNNDSTLDSPAIAGISGRAPYDMTPTYGGVTFCRKCFLTWAGIFLIVALIFFGRK